MSEAELVLDAKAVLGEGPVWHEEHLWWVDIESCKLNILNPLSGENQVIDTGERVGVAVPRQSGGAVIGLESGLYFLDLESGERRPVTDPESDLPDNRFNDGKCDPSGRFWAGTMDMTEAGPSGSLYRLDPDASLHKMHEGVTVSNGLAWTADRKTMYYIDSPRRVVWAFDYDDDTGAISNQRTVIEIPDGDGYPDGMTIDENDQLWVCLWDGAAISHWDPREGTLIKKYQMPCDRVTSACFGGPGLDELYITTASIHLSDEQRAAQPLAGGIFRLRPGVRGLPGTVFAG